MAQLNDLQCAGDALFQGDVKVNGKLNNEVFDVDDNCMIIDVCRRLDLSTVGNSIEIKLPDGYVCDPRSGVNLAFIAYSTYGSVNEVWTTNAEVLISYVDARTGSSATSTITDIASSQYSTKSISPYCADSITLSVTTACTGATKPYALITCRIFCHKES